MAHTGNLSAKKREAVTRRLAADEEWAGTPFGKLCQRMIDTDVLSVNVVAEYIDKSPTHVHRWMSTYRTQGNTHEESEQLNAKFKELVVKLDAALAQGLLPAPQDRIVSILNEL